MAADADAEWRTDMDVLFADLGFPVWLRATHWINALFIGFMIRSGIQILASYPRLNWGETSKPGQEWLRFTRRKFRKDEYYITLEEEEEASPLIAQPGGSNLGLGRHWHFFGAVFWLLNGIVYVALLCITGEWSRLVPTTWAIFPNAWGQMVAYLTFHGPVQSLYIGVYDPLQQLAYFAVVFLLTPFQILTAAAQSPAVEAYLPWYAKLFGGRQGARSLHFLGLVAYIGFIFVHTAMVFLTDPRTNFGDIIFGQHVTRTGTAVAIGLSIIILIFVIYGLTSWLSRRYPTAAQKGLSVFIRPWMSLLARKTISRQHYRPEEVSEFFIVNGFGPDSDEYLRMLWNGFKEYKLSIGGLVERPRALSLDELKALPRQTQITKHNCIQGWSSIGQWTGVPMSQILDLVQPRPEAQYVVFRSYSKDNAGKEYFEVLSMDVARHPQTILAYEMNGQPLPLAHGAPLRLRAEVLLGFKMVKWLRSIECVETYANIRDGLGGSREENKHYEQAVPI
jgi:sulfoxide reductase catalytic subunit YedY